MKIFKTQLDEVFLLEPQVHGDERGWFMEVYRADRLADLGMPVGMQVNMSFSRRGVVRGLHLQHPGEQAKLVQAVSGSIFDAAVDVRRGSPTFGCWAAAELSAENRRQLLIPAGFAHGFCATSEHATVVYLCDTPYRPNWELGVRWDDPQLRIPWPLEGEPELSSRDRKWPALAEIRCDRLPLFEATTAVGRARGA